MVFITGFFIENNSFIQVIIQNKYQLSKWGMCGGFLLAWSEPVEAEFSASVGTPLPSTDQRSLLHKTLHTTQSTTRTVYAEAWPRKHARQCVYYDSLRRYLCTYNQCMDPARLSKKERKKDSQRTHPKFVLRADFIQITLKYSSSSRKFAIHE